MNTIMLQIWPAENYANIWDLIGVFLRMNYPARVIMEFNAQAGEYEPLIQDGYYNIKLPSDLVEEVEMILAHMSFRIKREEAKSLPTHH